MPHIGLDPGLCLGADTGEIASSSLAAGPLWWWAYFIRFIVIGWRHPYYQPQKPGIVTSRCDLCPIIPYYEGIKWAYPPTRPPVTRFWPEWGSNYNLSRVLLLITSAAFCLLSPVIIFTDRHQAGMRLVSPGCSVKNDTSQVVWQPWQPL